ncbi:MAG: nucleotidyl transferase AbiEii/AbiGii toxin family protein [Steroidobacteraceae bacterium]
MNQFYVDAARLLIQVAPVVFESGVFALKGGTAINLFVRDMPRLSVDLDLVFPDHSLPRDQALAQINEAIRQASSRLKTRGFQVRTVTATGAGETKILVRRGNIEIKVEVNFVLRGTVYPVSLASLSAKAREILQGEIEVPMASITGVAWVCSPHSPTNWSSFLPCSRSSQRNTALPRPMVSRRTVPSARTAIWVLIRRPRM